MLRLMHRDRQVWEGWEDDRILELAETLQRNSTPKWGAIAKALPGRTDAMVKRRYMKLVVRPVIPAPACHRCACLTCLAVIRGLPCASGVCEMVDLTGRVEDGWP